MTITVQPNKDALEIPEGTQIKVQLGEDYFILHPGTLWDAINKLSKDQFYTAASSLIDSVKERD